MLNPIGVGAFCLLGALSTDNDAPERASRPFDATRNGFVLGEGAGFLVLEHWDAARKRGAHIYAELAGDGNSLSSYRITDSHPSGDGPIQAMQQALADAGLSPEDIDYVNAHGTSTVMNDRSECAALRVVMGQAS
jgi:3-oxoacyl-(acyl-carrier-protein) synthase